jgi:hypothetical protein
MARITCTRCGAAEDEVNASFSETGLICCACLRADQANDQARWQEKLDEGARDLGRAHRGMRRIGIFRWLDSLFRR